MTRASYLLHPLVIAGLALWVINDHLLKGAYPGWWTGKLSDLAGLAVFPLIPYAVIDLWRARRGLPPPPVSTLALCIAAAGLALIAIKTTHVAADAYRWSLAAAQWPIRALRVGAVVPLRPVRLARDLTDLLALPALLVPWFVVRSRVTYVRRTAPPSIASTAP
jgi:hypothetical protein